MCQNVWNDEHGIINVYSYGYYGSVWQFEDMDGKWSSSYERYDELVKQLHPTKQQSGKGAQI